MTNLVEIFQFIKEYGNSKELFQDSKSFFCDTKKNRACFIDQINDIVMIESWIGAITEEGNFMLTNGGHRIDYLFVCGSVANGRIQRMYLSIKSIRAEMLSMTTSDTLEQFKKLNDFWETLELSLQVMMK